MEEFGLSTLHNDTIDSVVCLKEQLMTVALSVCDNFVYDFFFFIILLVKKSLGREGSFFLFFPRCIYVQHVVALCCNCSQGRQSRRSPSHQGQGHQVKVTTHQLALQMSTTQSCRQMTAHLVRTATVPQKHFLQKFCKKKKKNLKHCRQPPTHPQGKMLCNVQHQRTSYSTVHCY